jgi:hypothetical protein
MGRPKLPRGNCHYCGTALNRPIKRYCNVRCQQAHTRRRYIDAWLEGSASGVDSWANVSDHVRRYLFEKYRGCIVCGWAERNPLTGKIPLHIDHIDGDWSNNRPENLRLLCPNHHALTASYGALNRGKGRPYHVVKRRGGEPVAWTRAPRDAIVWPIN